jgi:small subunit ribosomal protein S8
MNKSLITFLIKIKNASYLQKEVVITNNSFLNFSVAKMLYSEGYIQSFKIQKNKNVLQITLRYFQGKSVLTNLKIVSSSSKLKFMNYLEIIKISSPGKNFFFSTSSGFVTIKECKKTGIGGILSFKI